VSAVTFRFVAGTVDQTFNGKVAEILLRCSVDYRAEIQAALGNGFPIERELEGAGASHVFLAEELALGRKVVVKMLPKKLKGDVSAERFQREIAVAARLQHPHLVPLLTAGIVADSGAPWFTMPYVEGESLRELLLRRGQLPVVTAARLMREIASALAYAHGRGVVHRDIKPENVLLSDGVAMVTDFGVAMAVDSAASEAGSSGRRLTGAGASLGTPAYSAPEQIISAGTVDHRADLYSFGCLAYEILAGSPPFTGRGLRDLLNAQIREMPVPIEHVRGGLPPALSHVIMRCLEKDPANRPESGAEIVRVIDSVTLSSLSDSGEVRTLVPPARAQTIEARTEALPPAPASRLPLMLLLLAAAAIATAVVLYGSRLLLLP
jgi:serine/threonine-protein kinase